MERLTTLDAGFLEAEDADQHISLAVGGVSVLEGPMPDFEELAADVLEKAAAVPRMRQVLRTHLLDMQPPEWVDVPNVDLSHHIHHVALPQPGSDQELFRLTADIMERRLDRERPLWECWMIEGLAGGHWAMLLKIHHCIADGITIMHMLSQLTDGGAGDSFATDIRAAKEGSGQKNSPKIGLNPLNWARSGWRLAAAATTSAELAFGGALRIAGGILSPADGSPLIGSVTTMRRYSAARVSLQDVAKVRDTFGVTLNDVALAAVTASYRAALTRRGKSARRNSLRTLVPVSVRSNDAMGITDNRVSVMLPFLPVDREDPVDRLMTVHQRLNVAKSSGEREAGSAFIAAVNVIPFPLTAWTVRALTRLPQRGVVALATNVPGPRHRLRIMDREVVRMMPIPPIALGLRTGVAIVSYADELTFGITADYDAAPDVDELAAGIEHGVAELVALL
ncbi:acyltransferase, WS/DGAT/MGAT [Mycolicibacterium rhodesiae NBB3]|uniref:Diacylglycerol O-acyltransferase n=1 Tax=Mycolicibacterium rhodesiae (strain NBB3) TaxID=710685 RepID=G8RQA7_MYCRN|nr:wax ester/triacylglycerol synthase family O-acyltransferase [Mycolicibacterium rhodesiae]AEV76373.1 acyltransferase, WS/DGAT/MGAT [Mycolicibacterium rhodesiae NBB3]